MVKQRRTALAEREVANWMAKLVLRRVALADAQAEVDAALVALRRAKRELAESRGACP